jgi:hypothetical protein
MQESGARNRNSGGLNGLAGRERRLFSLCAPVPAALVHGVGREASTLFCVRRLHHFVVIQADNRAFALLQSGHGLIQAYVWRPGCGELRRRACRRAFLKWVLSGPGLKLGL